MGYMEMIVANKANTCVCSLTKYVAVCVVLCLHAWVGACMCVCEGMHVCVVTVEFRPSVLSLLD